MSNFSVLNLQKLLEEFGEEAVKEKLAEYSCPQNPEIDLFLHKNAIESVKKHQTSTFLVSSEDNDFCGYFSLTHKALEIKGGVLSNTARKKISMHSEFDSESDSYTISAFLIAQFGKNYSNNLNTLISGKEMMDLVFEILSEVRVQIGGNLIYLECEDNPKLIKFYESLGFVCFGERISKKECVKYIQLFRFF